MLGIRAADKDGLLDGHGEVINRLGFAADVLLWEIDAEEAGRSGFCVVFLCGVVQHPVSKICHIFCRINWHSNAGENASDLHCCTHVIIMEAEQLYVSRMAKVTRTGMVMTITITLALSK